MGWPKFGKYAIVGIGLRLATKEIFATLHGRLLGTVTILNEKEPLYPTIGITDAEAEVLFDPVHHRFDIKTLPEYCDPIFGKLETSDRNSSKMIILFSNGIEDEAQRNHLEAQLKLASKQALNNYGYQSFFTQENKGMAEEFRKFAGIKRSPLLLAFNKKKQKKYAIPEAEEITSERILQLLEGIETEKITSLMKSAERPPNDRNSECPTLFQVVGESFDELVIQGSQDVLVDININSADCKVLLETLSRVFEDNPNIIVARFDCEHNDYSCKNLSEDSLPNIVLFRGSNKAEPVIYKGARSLEQLIRFLHSSASETFDLEATLEKVKRTRTRGQSIIPKIETPSDTIESVRARTAVFNTTMQHLLHVPEFTQWLTISDKRELCLLNHECFKTYSRAIVNLVYFRFTIACKWFHPKKIILSYSFDKDALQAIAPSITHLILADHFPQSPHAVLPLFTNLTFFDAGIQTFPSSRFLSPSPQLAHLSNTFDIPTSPLPGLTHISFSEMFNRPVTNLPPSVTHISFTGWSFNNEIPSLPEGVTHLFLNKGFNCIVPSLPPALTHLTFGSNFNQEVDNVLPPYLTHLEFGDSFNKMINALPQGLLSLSFGKNFNSAVDRLPSSITHLSFGTNFSRNVDLLPISLTHLKFGYYFNEPVPSLPASLLHLTFGNSFNKPVTALPASLTHLVFGDKFVMSVASLPISLTHLTFGFNFNDNIGTLPPNLVSLTFPEQSMFNGVVTALPASLTHLSLGFYFNLTVSWLPSTITHLKLNHHFNLPVNTLPSSLVHLVLGNNFSQSVNSLPQSLRQLTFGNNFNFPVDSLPHKLTHLTFGNGFSQQVHSLPPCLTHLTFGNDFDQSADSLPSSITHLTFMFAFNRPVDTLPSSLTHLVFGSKFSQPVNSLPPSVTHLTFGTSFNQAVDSLPISLVHLTFGVSFNFPVDMLPLGLTHLTFDYHFNQTVDFLPRSLTHLTFGHLFNQPVDFLPPLLTHLAFGYSFSHPVFSLPSTISHLTFGHKFNHMVPLPHLTKLVVGPNFDGSIPDYLPIPDALKGKSGIKQHKLLVHSQPYQAQRFPQRAKPPIPPQPTQLDSTQPSQISDNVQQPQSPSQISQSPSSQSPQLSPLSPPAPISPLSPPSQPPQLPQPPIQEPQQAQQEIMPAHPAHQPQQDPNANAPIEEQHEPSPHQGQLPKSPRRSILRSPRLSRSPKLKSGSKTCVIA